MDLNTPKKHLALAAITLALTALPVAASAGPSFNHLGLALGTVEIDDTNDDGDGIRVDGSVAATPLFHLFGSYASWDFDGDVERTDLEIGGGINSPVGSNTDIVGELSYVNREVEVNNVDEDNDGFGLRGGVRTLVTPRLDIGAGLVHYALDEEDLTGLWAEGYFDVVDQIAVGAELEALDEETSFLIGGRFKF